MSKNCAEFRMKHPCSIKGLNVTVKNERLIEGGKTIFIPSLCSRESTVAYC